MSLSMFQLNNNNQGINSNIDDEWALFMSNTTKYNDSDSDSDSEQLDLDLDSSKISANMFDELSLTGNTNTNANTNANTNTNTVVPEPTPIYISTKSKIAYLTHMIDLNIFWQIPVIPYATPSNGVIKKQIKFNSKTQEELNIIQSKLQHELYYEEQIMTHIDNPNGRIKFKDIRKVSVGISKKDIMTYRGKKKQAFYNCFVLIIRIKMGELFREFHIKVFNTGKLEIPGVQSDEMFERVLETIIAILQPHLDTQLSYKQESDTVLINSNFNCGFYINREALFDILKYKYHIDAIYDPCCSYPGIQCKFHFNNDILMQTGIQITSEHKELYKNITTVSFMIFRTGSVLIVGMCEENVLNVIYEFLTKLLKAEFKYISQSVINNKHIILKDKKKKIRKKTIMITVNGSADYVHETPKLQLVTEVADLDLVEDDTISVKKGKKEKKEKVIKEKKEKKEKVIKEKVIKEKVIKEKVIKEKVIKEKKEKAIKEKVIKEKVIKEKKEKQEKKEKKVKVKPELVLVE
jgi:hypothetical protein